MPKNKCCQYKFMWRDFCYCHLIFKSSSKRKFINGNLTSIPLKVMATSCCKKKMPKKNVGTTDMLNLSKYYILRTSFLICTLKY